MPKIRAQLAEIRVTDERVEAAAQEARTIGLEARIAAQLPKVQVTYLPGGPAKSASAARPLTMAPS